MIADLHRKYNLCEFCGSPLRETNEYNKYGEWEGTTIECVGCEQHFEIIN